MRSIWSSFATLRLHPSLLAENPVAVLLVKANLRMGQDPREAWRKLQKSFASGTKGGMPGGPRNFFGLSGGVVLLVVGGVVVNNALFNGRQRCKDMEHLMTNVIQWTVVTEL